MERGRAPGPLDPSNAHTDRRHHGHGACGDPPVYARALAQLEHLSHEAPHFAMAAMRGSLVDRIQRLVGAHAPSDHVLGGRGTVAVVAGLLAVGATSYASFSGESSQYAAPARVATAGATGDESASSRDAVPADGADSATETAHGVLGQAPASPAPVDRDEAGEPPSRPAGSGGFIDSFAAAGYRDLSVDQLIALKVHGVTPQFISEAKAAGLTPSLDQIIALRVHGVDFAVVGEMTRLGYDTLDTDQIVSMRVHGVTPAFAEAMQQAGLRDLDLNRLVQLRVHGVNAERLREFARVGYPVTSADQAAQLSVHGVTPNFIRRAQARGFKDLTLEQIIQLRIAAILDEPEARR